MKYRIHILSKFKMVNCCVPLCTSSSSSGSSVKLYNIPKDIHKRLQYANKIRRPNWVPSDHDKICEKHFDQHQFKIRFGKRLQPPYQRILKDTAIPTIFPHLNLSNETRSNYDNATKIRKNVESILKDHQYFGNTSEVQTNSSNVDNPDVIKIQEAEIELKSSDHELHLQALENKDLKLKLQQKALENKDLKLQLQQQINKIEALEEQNRILKEEKANGFLSKDLFKKIFGDDQIQFLKNKGKVRKWSDDTIKKGLRLRFAAGTTAYNDLIKEGYPLPSIRTLNERTEHIKLEPGSFDEVIEMMGDKYNGKPDHEKLFTLSLDEMSLKAGCGIEYDIRSDSYVGDSTLPGHSGEASKALVFQLASIGGPRVKQVIGYHLTPSSVDSTPVAEIIEDIICKTHHVGITIMVVTADAGSTNKGAFSKLGCELTKNSDFINYFQHPCDETVKVYVIFDQPHVLKSLASMLRSHGEFTLPEEFVKKHDLPSNVVKLEHISNLLDFQNKTLLKLSPHLRKESIDPAHFQKMNVGLAMSLFSREVANGLRYLVQEEENYPKEMLTTAFFAEFVARWMELVNSRFHSIALSKHNTEVYDKAIQHLEEMIELFHKINIGGKWKIVQTSIITTTKSIIDLQNMLLSVHKFQFVLTARFSQDSLKNIFSQIRGRNCDPSAREFLYCLRAIMISQYLREVKTSNYDHDDAKHALDFLTKKKTENLEEDKVDEFINDEELQEFLDKYALTANKEYSIYV